MCLEFFLEEKEDTRPEYPPQTTLFPSPHPPLHFPPMSVSFIALAPWGKGDGASPFSRWAVVVQWRGVACSRSASLLSSGLRAPPSTPNIFPAPSFGCHLISCCGHSGVRGREPFCSRQHRS